MKRGGVRAAAALMVALAALAGAGARAQDAGAPPQDVNVELGPLPQPVTVLVRERPTVTAFLRGDYGEVRVSGVLEQAPTAPLRFTDPSGRNRETGWLEIRSLGQVAYATEGLPVGSYQASLVSDPVDTATGLTGGVAGGGYGSRTLNLGQAGWRILQLPEGTMTLRGDPYGTFSFPVSRLSGFQMEPVRGNVEELPKGEIRLEVFNGTQVALPLPEVRLFQRDVPAGTATVILRDEQTFTGKLVSVPNVSLVVDTTPRGKVTIPLEQVVQFERSTGAGRRL